jgi:hypothetical protein
MASGTASARAPPGVYSPIGSGAAGFEMSKNFMPTP